MDLWFGLLKENIEANGGTAIAPENYTRVKVSFDVFLLQIANFFFKFRQALKCGNLLIHLVNMS